MQFEFSTKEYCEQYISTRENFSDCKVKDFSKEAPFA